LELMGLAVAGVCKNYTMKNSVTNYGGQKKFAALYAVRKFILLLTKGSKLSLF
jgi:hypothetical protein